MIKRGNQLRKREEEEEDTLDNEEEEEGEETAEEEDAEYSSKGQQGPSGVVLTNGKNLKKRNSTSTGRKRVPISFIPDKSKRLICFTKRKGGLIKKVSASL